jgi:hypothetical protein
MTLPRHARYYIRRQTNAGHNQGKWRVHRPDGQSVNAPACDTLREAMILCSAFMIAALHPAQDPDDLPVSHRYDLMHAGPDYSIGGFGDGRHYITIKGIERFVEGRSDAQPITSVTLTGKEGA